MNCEKCGKEIPENETFCPDCGGEQPALEPVEETAAVVEEMIAEEPVAEEILAEDQQEVTFNVEELGVPVTNVVRKKRGLARVIVGIISLVIAAILVVISLLNPVMLLGKWKNHDEQPLFEDVVLKVDFCLEFTLSGECNQFQRLLNYEELGVPKEESEYTDHYRFAIVNEKIRLNEEVDSDVCYKATPSELTIWAEGYPESSLEYQRDGLLYPSMILWVAGGAILILGVLLLAIPGKKHVVTTYEEVEEAEDLDEFLDEIYEEIEADPEDVSAEEFPEEPAVDDVTNEPVAEEITDQPETTEE